MRLVVGMLLCIVGGEVVLADAPAPPAASDVAKAPSSPALALIDPREKTLRAKGYRLEIRRGERIFCRSEEVLGSRLGGRKVCGTIEALEEREHLSQAMTESAQRQQLNPPGK